MLSGKRRPTRYRSLVTRHARGFTLVELVLVASVLGILLVASVPRFAQTANRLRVEQAAFELTQLLRYARERAVAQGREVRWVWEDDTRQAHLEAVGEDGQPALIPERAAHSSPLIPDASAALRRGDKSVGCKCIRFFPDGTSESTTIAVRFHELIYTVTVHEATGQACLAAGTTAC